MGQDITINELVEAIEAFEIRKKLYETRLQDVDQKDQRHATHSELAMDLNLINALENFCSTDSLSDQSFFSKFKSRRIVNFIESLSQEKGMSQIEKLRITKKQLLKDMQAIRHSADNYAIINSAIQAAEDHMGFVLKDVFKDEDENGKTKKPIGEGFFGEVYKGTYQGRSCAIKEQKTNKTKEEIEDAKRESYIAWALTTPPNSEKDRFKNIIKTLGIQRTKENNIQIISEFAEGGTVEDFLYGDKERTLQERLYIAKEILAGVSQMHHAHIIHGDIAIRNALLTKNPSGGYGIKINDMGLSQNLNVDNHFIAPDHYRLPLHNSPPEVINSRKFTFSSDVYSIGFTIAELLMDRPPYGDVSDSQVIKFKNMPGKNLGTLLEKAIADKDIYIPNEEAKKLLVNIVNNCTQDDPNLRPSLASVQAELDTAFKILFGVQALQSNKGIEIDKPKPPKKAVTVTGGYITNQTELGNDVQDEIQGTKDDLLNKVNLDSTDNETNQHKNNTKSGP